MMSPLAISQYLPKKCCFDVIIFDEASQVVPEDALGAIARARQLIVVGDQKQLPPTSFFTSISDFDKGDEQEDDTTSMESLIDLALACGQFKERHLLWHYRSQHESLIRLASKEFYDDKLIYAPSPSRSPGRGLHYVRTNGFYQRGSGVNPGEAREIAKAVHEFLSDHFPLTSPEELRRSLGVISFSKAQEQVIWDELNKIAKNSVDMMDYLNDKSPEAFFVKNLENVQGDERDVIFISVCYGKNDEGRIYQNFGPVNNIGGERRLNVMMTRARQECRVFANFSGNDLALTEKSPRGIALLSEFLKYAEFGKISMETSQGGFESPFEESVAYEIEKAGYKYQSQLGVDGFRIDLAVRHPQASGKYILAVECDGATYHSSRSARDRDRLREALLRGRGWNIYRIWSTDWRRDRVGEVARLKIAIQDAVSDTQEEFMYSNPDADQKGGFGSEEETKATSSLINSSSVS